MIQIGQKIKIPDGLKIETTSYGTIKTVYDNSVIATFKGYPKEVEISKRYLVVIER